MCVSATSKQDIATGWVYWVRLAESTINWRLIMPMACLTSLVEGMVMRTGVCWRLTMRLYIPLIVSPSFIAYLPLRLRLSKLLCLASAAKPSVLAPGAASAIFAMTDAELSCGVMYMYAVSSSCTVEIFTE